MPIYAYRCASCGHQLDALQKLSEAPLVDCPACGAAALAKLLTAPGFQLKGSGWYATDFKGGSKPSAGADAKADGKSEAPAATTESKGESKSESKGETSAASSSGGCGSGCACH